MIVFEDSNFHFSCDGSDKISVLQRSVIDDLIMEASTLSSFFYFTTN